MGVFFLCEGQIPKITRLRKPMESGSPKAKSMVDCMTKKILGRDFDSQVFSDHVFTLWGCYVSIGAIEKRAFLAHTHMAFAPERVVFLFFWGESEVPKIDHLEISVRAFYQLGQETG